MAGEAQRVVLAAEAADEAKNVAVAKALAQAAVEEGQRARATAQAHKLALKATVKAHQRTLAAAAQGHDAKCQAAVSQAIARERATRAREGVAITPNDATCVICFDRKANQMPLPLPARTCVRK